MSVIFVLHLQYIIALASRPFLTVFASPFWLVTGRGASVVKGEGLTSDLSLPTNHRDYQSHRVTISI